MFITISTDSKRCLLPDTLAAICEAFNRFTYGNCTEMKNSLTRSKFPVDLQYATEVNIRRRYGKMTIYIHFHRQHLINTDTLPQIAEDVFGWVVQEVFPNVRPRCGLLVEVKEYTDPKVNVYKQAAKGAWWI